MYAKGNIENILGRRPGSRNTTRAPGYTNKHRHISIPPFPNQQFDGLQIKNPDTRITPPNTSIMPTNNRPQPQVTQHSLSMIPMSTQRNDLTPTPSLPGISNLNQSHANSPYIPTTCPETDTFPIPRQQLAMPNRRLPYNLSAIIWAICPISFQVWKPIWNEENDPKAVALKPEATCRGCGRSIRIECCNPFACTPDNAEVVANPLTNTSDTIEIECLCTSSSFTFHLQRADPRFILVCTNRRYNSYH